MTVRMIMVIVILINHFNYGYDDVNTMIGYHGDQEEEGGQA